MGKEENKPLMQSIRENASAFRTFLYNSEEKTVLGRNSSSWGRISVFYLFYYAFLAALFAISIHITYSLMPTERPYYQTRLQTPGLTIQPKLPSKDASNSDIIYTMTKSESYEKYVNHLTDFLKAYNDSEYGPCARTETEKAYREGKPCIFLKLNKIIDWNPIPFDNAYATDEKQDPFQKRREEHSEAPSLDAWIDQQGMSYKKYAWVYVSCYGVKSKKTTADDKKAIGTMTAHPDGLSLKAFPYKGKSEKDTYLSPIMAMQFNNITKNTDIKVGCKAYAQNILDETRINAGFIHFTMKVCNTDTCVKA